MLRKNAARLAMSIALGAMAAATPACAQIADDNVLAESEDAFGTQVGTESTGIYTDYDTRGFSPLDAGNSRIDGIYFDQVWNLSSRLRHSTAIRVGFSAVDTPFVAPTGVVDQELHSAPKAAGNSLILNKWWYGGYFNEWEYRLPINDRIAVRGGLGVAEIGLSDGSDSTSFASTTRAFVRIGEMEFSPFYVFGENTRDETKPIALVGAGYLPKVPPSRKYLGQKWAAGTRDYLNAGATLKGRVFGDVSFRGGIFRSVNDKTSSFTEIYDVRSAQGTAAHYLLADPNHDVRSTSGEAMFVWRFGGRGSDHRLFAGYRGRNRLTETGGAQYFDYGLVQYGDIDLHPEPEFSFTDVNRGRVRQSSWMAAYTGSVIKGFHLNIGVQKASYRGSIRNGETGLVDRTTASPWLYNAAALVTVTPEISAYVATQKGLEDSGIAPGNAANRDEQLPAVRSTQYEGGVRWNFGSGQLVLAAFQITKPYFSFDADRDFVVLGDERHRGLEASFAGHLGERLGIVAGAVLMDPVVTGPGRNAGLVGARPAGVAKIFGRVDMNYRTDLPGNLTFTGAFEYKGSTPATAAPIDHLGDRQLFVKPFWTVDFGFRQTFPINKTTLSIRAVMRDIFDKAGWHVTAPDVVIPTHRRSSMITASLDF